MGVSPLLLQVQLTIPLYANHGGKEKMLLSYGVIGNISLTYTFETIWSIWYLLVICDEVTTYHNGLVKAGYLFIVMLLRFRIGSQFVSC